VVESPDLEQNTVLSATLASSPVDTQNPDRPAVDHTRVYLLVFQGDSSRMVPLRGDGDVVIGRDASAVVVIQDASVSRRHACLTLVDGLATIRDLRAMLVKALETG